MQGIEGLNLALALELTSIFLQRLPTVLRGGTPFKSSATQM